MKKTIITAIGVLALSSSVAFAAPGGQGDCHGPNHGKRGGGEHMMMGGGDGSHMTRLFERLDLSEAQRTQIMQLRTELQAGAAPQHEAMKQNMQALREAKRSGDEATADSLKATMEAQRAEMMKIRESHHEQILQILTPEQREQFEELKSERGARRGGKNRGPGGRF